MIQIEAHLNQDDHKRDNDDAILTVLRTNANDDSQRPMLRPDQSADLEASRCRPSPDHRPRDSLKLVNLR